jgi:hypothetical protein
MENYKWLLYPILSSEPDQLINGLTFNSIKDCLIAKHEKGRNLNLNNLLMALNSLTALQIEKGITPNILDYDQTNMRLNVVDKEFLIWLSFQEKNELFSLAGFTGLN